MRQNKAQVEVVPYIGTWIETRQRYSGHPSRYVVPYIGTWIETCRYCSCQYCRRVVPYIGTWIETSGIARGSLRYISRTLYRYVD